MKIITRGEKKFVFKTCHCDEAYRRNEVAFSRLGQQMDIRVAKNEHGQLGFLKGIYSEYFLQPDERVAWLVDYVLLGALGAERFQQVPIDRAIKACRDKFGENLHPDFVTNFVETYLFSVLVGNGDHNFTGKANLEITKNKKTKLINMATYHDFELTTHDTTSKRCEEINHEILGGYKKNIGILRADHKQIHEKFLDNAACADLDCLDCTEVMRRNIEKQVEYMMDFTSRDK